jgi:glucose/arabinose dehydrogenase
VTVDRARCRTPSRRSFALTGLALVVAVLAAACGSSSKGAAPTPATTSTTAVTTTTAPAATTTTAPAPAGDLAAVRFKLNQVATLDQPVAMASRPGHIELYVAEKGGRVRVLDGGSAALIDIHGDVSTGNEQGLLGLAFSPDGAFLYASYTNPSGDTRIDEWAMGAGARDIDLGSRRQVFALDQPAANHNGGNILFGPDGHLWFGLGDGGGSGDPYGNSQDPGKLLGTFLRIDPRPSGQAAYTSPADNPFAASGGRAEVAILGLRNPWRFSFDRATGDLWIGDVGQDKYEEVDRLPAGHILGANLGWPYMEGTHPFKGGAPDGIVGPVTDYGRGDGQSVIGGFVYRGAAIPSLAGVYLFADAYKSGIRLLALRDSGAEVRESGVVVPDGMPVSFGQDNQGELYVLSLNGGVFRLEAA